MITRLKTLIGRMLHGEIPLVRMFWLGLLLGGYVLMPLIAVLIGGILGIVTHLIIGTYRPALALAGIAIIAYWVVAIVGTWQSASNYQGKLGWGYFAKGADILLVIFMALQLPDRALQIADFATSR